MPICRSVNKKDAREKTRSFYTIPTNVIAPYVGAISDIPSGWIVCDGNNSTPNLNERYPRIVSSGDGNTGGTNSVSSNGHKHNSQWRAPNATKSTGYDDVLKSTSQNDPTTTVTSINVDTRPSSIDYVFIQSNGSAKFEKGVSAFRKENKNDINNPIFVNDGSNNVPNASNRNIRGSITKSGNKFGSDSGNYSHSHGWDYGKRNNVDDNVEDYTGYDGVNGSSENQTFSIVPKSVKFYIATELLRYGIKKKTDFEGSMFLYEGSVSNLPSGWSQITSYSERFVRVASSDGDLENKTSAPSWPGIINHYHTYSEYFDKLEYGNTNYIESNPRTDANNDGISGSLPPYYDLKLVEAVSV